MKKLLSLFLCLCFISAVFAQLPSDFSFKTDAAYANGGYKTYTMKDAALLSKIGDGSVTIGGKSYSITAMQGFNVGTTYAYSAKIHNANDDIEAAKIYRTTISSGATTEMTYYSSTSAASSSVCTSVGHANDIQVVTVDSVNYMYVATSDSTKAMARLKISGTSLYFTGYFKLVTVAGSEISCSSMRLFKHSSGQFIFLFKYGQNFYYGKFSDTAAGGTASKPTEIKVYRIAILDKRNAVFAKSNSSYGTLANVETWVPQGFFYNSAEKVIYVPYFLPNQGNGINTNIIVTYYAGDILKESNFDYATNKSTYLLPTKTSFYLKSTDYNSACTSMEVEGCGFRSGQGTDGDLKLYFNANGSPTSSYEGVYYLSYKSGTGDFTPIADSSTPVYTVSYDANGGTDSGTNTTAGYFKMSDTKHVYGISTNLRPNYFTKTGYTFAGWYLYRKSDKKWLYMNNGTKSWYVKGEQPVGAYLALYSDKQTVSKLSNEDGDTVTCYAQWTPDATGTKSYYIQFDANGGKGSMEDQKIVYNTTTAIRKNTFTRSGYQFSGWIAYRRASGTWFYRNNTTLAISWIAPGSSTEGYFMGAYTDGGNIATTSATDRDIVTFYAAWTKTENAGKPGAIKQGTQFKPSGQIESDAGLYSVTVSVLDSGGKTVLSKTQNPFAHTYDLSKFGTSVDFTTLAPGSYTYKVTAMTIKGSTPTDGTTVNLIESAFSVTDNAEAITGTLDIGGITAPAYNETPVSASDVTTGAHYACTSLSWSPACQAFASGTVYTATVTLTADADHVFSDNTVTVAGSSSITGPTLSNGNKTLTFTAVFPGTATLKLKESAAAGGGIRITDGYLIGLAPERTADTVKALFEYDVALSNGSGYIGTGCTVSCADKECTVVVSGDTDGDGTVSANDYSVVKAAFKHESFDLDIAYKKAADINGDGKNTISDYIMIKRHVSGTYDIFA